MKKTFTLLAAFLLVAIVSNSQLRVGLVAGGHQSKVVEENDLPNWSELEKGYTGRTGVHFGVLADIRLGKKSNFYLQPGIIYHNKGRKFAATYDTTVNDIFRVSSNEFINYLDMPFNLVYKMRLGGNVKFILGAGPYLSFFYTGKLKTETVSKNLEYESIENNDPPVGNGEGKYSVFDYGLNGLAGFEIGKVMLTANYSQGFGDFYKSDLYDGTFRHQVFGATLGVFIDGNKKKKIDSDGDGITDEMDKCPTVAGSMQHSGCPDLDNDGIPDNEDQCPGEAGPESNKGCPLDEDKDGVYDKDDACPTVPGLKDNKGCPAADADKDGVVDAEDKCPTVAGHAKYGGCPIPDTDGDGINDEEDKCPAEKGKKAFDGCPEPVKKEIVEKVNYAAKRIQFAKGNAKLLPSTHKVLNEVVTILKQNPNLLLSVEGHTSGDGIRDANMKLSRDRANAVRAYLISKGISSKRITARGYGPDKMLNAGKTEEEKALNRRVELKLSNQ